MTKEEFTRAKEKTDKYQSYEYLLDKIDESLKNIKKFSNITLDGQYTGIRTNFSINAAMRESLISMIQNYREEVANAMEAL